MANSQILEGSLGVYRKGDALWFPYDADIDLYHSEFLVDLTLTDGTQLPSRTAFVRPFVTERGDTLMYLKPHKLPATSLRSANRTTPFVQKVHR